MTTLSLVATAVVMGIAGWLSPFAATAFLVAGAIPFYAMHHMLKMEVSGELTGVVLGALGSVAFVRLATRGTLTDRRAQAAALFVSFVLLWYLRWHQEPPAAPTEFGDRSGYFMYVFAVVPFAVGLAVRDLAGVRRLMCWVAGWGALGIATVGAYYATGQPSHSPIYGRWVPIPGMGSIPMALELGMGALAVALVLGAMPGVLAKVLRIVVLAAAAGLIAAVGQRGPFMFFAIAVLGQAALDRGPSGPRRVLVPAFVAIAVGIAALSISGDPAARVLDARNYTAEGNVDRLTLLEFAAEVIPERPLVGWGGSLVGQPVGNNQTWIYVHAAMLDPLVETGLFGALPIWILVGGVLLRAGRLAFSRSSAGASVRSLLPLFAFVFMEYQVSSHISAAKQMWLLIALLVVAGECDEGHGLASDGADPTARRRADARPARGAG